ncbi:hypothetical protein [Nonomuraea zeae]|uniref:Uncharacterized protein n=1 Tax=Nonomuraea zeae TaxID=1642303 RepID=A0A5S4F2D9_9ACTN|nr:hypothetical protein [Nonomuraea zeae]TMR10249.1 hypothetical protein ETD85_60655 [Nonomuraea zeae]
MGSAGGSAAAEEEVAAWFDTKPSMREVLAVAALAFLDGLAEPDFEVQLGRLERLCHESGRRPYGGSLIAASGGLVGFRAPGHRARVLGELVARYGFWLWQPLREWVRSLAGAGPEVQVRAAEGVAALAAYSVKEVREEFLEVWARGTAAERVAAAHALSYMCADETLAPTALRVALEWAADPGHVRATAAAVALGGGLALRFPADSVRSLHRLGATGGPAAKVAGQSLALLLRQAGGRDDDRSRELTALAAALRNE